MAFASLIFMMQVIALILLLMVTPAWASDKEGRWWYDQARTLYQEGELDRALALLEEIPKRFPEDRELALKARVLAGQILFEKKEYDKVFKTLKPLLQETILPPEGLLILSKSSESKGLFDEALIYIKLLRKHYPAYSRCEANLIEARIYERRHLIKRAMALAQGVVDGECSVPLKGQALSLLLRHGAPVEKLLPLIEQHPTVLRYNPEIVKILALYYLKKKDLKKAEQEIYKYLNYSGKEKEAPSLLFRLAEEYFSQHKYREARRIYELIFTSWPYADEAAFSKFRLYYMRYLFEEKIGHKTAHTRRRLLAICKLLKKDFPKEPITEEAHALEIKLLLEDRRHEEALASIWNFLELYPRSAYLPRVYEVLCKASPVVDQKFLGQKDYLGLIGLHLDHKKAFKDARCGLHFYWLAQAYQKLNLFGEALLSLLKARDFGVAKPWEPNLLLNLVNLLLERQEEDDLELARQLLEDAEKRFPELARTPYYLFLQGKLLFNRNRWPEALSPLQEAIKRTADEKLRTEARHRYLEALIKSGRFKDALALLKKEKNLDPLVLKRLALLALLYERLPLASKITEVLLEKSPKDDEVLWLRALVLEKLGEGQKAEKIWKTLAQKDSLYAKIASGIVRASSLIEQTRREIY